MYDCRFIFCLWEGGRSRLSTFLFFYWGTFIAILKSSLYTILSVPNDKCLTFANYCRVCGTHLAFEMRQVFKTRNLQSINYVKPFLEQYKHSDKKTDFNLIFIVLFLRLMIKKKKKLVCELYDFYSGFSKA